ncbi:T9SS type A sorting domain-containing protein [Epilithonimonas sp. JDS]|uniref:T9SS type A sorting domain-containing protein n=1 Tax=Epilithonimonas sp. JDS TaxID=2902797 RepID=UPI001E5A0115|nr:T9SS type A sorting domain-containing protein [Epilithonimonas sp. JDS]MCD9855996.1 T9SS type A sorting domain-containing protein [Epilithonimonas sp. JDS]
MKLNSILTLALYLLTFTQFQSQVTNEGKPKSWELKNIQKPKPINLPSFDLKLIQNEDQLNDKNTEIPFRFGHKFEVNYSLQNSGVWENLANGDRIWRIRFSSVGAVSMNFILKDFFIPIGAKLFLYNDDGTDLLGAYTFIQNNTSKTLGTWLVKGDDVYIEYFEPASQAGKGSFTIKNITHGYRSGGNLNASSDCNIDVNCSIGNDADPLKNVLKKSIGLVLVDGAAMCSGALINNTANDKKPYFLTANHCYSDPTTWAFRFNWISTNTVCGTTEDSVSNTDYHTISGATLKAKRESTDFCLVEINSEIPENWETVWSGWDRTKDISPWIFGIHHPAGDIMKVSRGGNPTLEGNMWTFNNWEMGSAEAGSSGSPLYNSNGKIIGQLCCGASFCNGTTYQSGYYQYGRLDVSWDGGGTLDAQLKDWLDPINSGVLILDNFPVLNLGNSESTVSNNIRVYPNPSKDIFIIDFDSVKNDLKFELFSSTGSLISKGKFGNKTNKVDLSGKTKGMYLLKLVEGKTAIKTFKLLKQ